MKNLKNLFIFFFMFLLVSCSSTSYIKAKSPTGEGYYDFTLQQDMYEISFNGNSNTSQIMAQDFALLRAAETCLENGYKTFDLVTTKDNTKTEMDSYTNYYGRYYSSTQIVSTTYPKIVLIIKCSKENNLTFIAEEIKTNLRKKYNLEN